MSLTVERSFTFRRRDEPAAQPTHFGRLPRVTRLMALAIKFDGYLKAGVVRDYAELARLGHVSRARLTQIMDLTLLAPDLQEAVLDFPLIDRGRDPIPEHALRAIAHEPDWAEQREAWKVKRDLFRAEPQAADDGINKMPSNG